MPAGLPAVRWDEGEIVASTVGTYPVRSLQVTGRIVAAAHPELETHLVFSLTWPADAQAQVPVVLEMSFGAEFMARLKERFTPEELAAFSGGGPPWQEQLLERGWGYASFETTTLQADNGDGLQRGIIGLANGGRPRKPEDWGALRAWGWGASRILDYLGSREEFDATRVAIFGHSRFGKAALVAMAFDTRIAAGFISSSGEGGAKLWRRHYGEQVGNIAGSGEYHWVAGNFLRYAGPLDVSDLPVDAHALIALCAPRPVFISAGAAGDEWTDPKGMFLAAAYASPVYELLDAGGLGSETYPPVGTLMEGGALAYRQHELGHTPGPNWSHFLDFVARHFIGDRAPTSWK